VIKKQGLIEERLIDCCMPPFRTSKTTALEIRPIHVRLADRTRGHALVVMLAYKIVQELANRWRNIELTVQEGINELSQVCAIEMRVNNKPFANRIPNPRDSIKKLLTGAGVHLPEIFSASAKKVATRKKLVERRKKS